MQPGEFVAVALTDDGVVVASATGTVVHTGSDMLPVLRQLDDAGARLVCWSARELAGPLSTAGWRPRACWDLAAVSRLLHGGGGDLQPAPHVADDMLDFDAAGHDDRSPARAREVAIEQLESLQSLPDPRATPGDVPLAVLTAYAESAAAVLAVELERTGLPVDVDAMAALLRPVIGERPVDEGHAAAIRKTRDDAVRRLFPAQ